QSGDYSSSYSLMHGTTSAPLLLPRPSPWGRDARLWPLFTVLLVFLGGCGKEETAPSAGYSGPARVSVMTFNVENLFDTKHDPGKADHTYLPLAKKRTARHKAACARIKGAYRRGQCLSLDWSSEALALKLERLRAAVLRAGGGRGPDILVLQEVENIRVLERLRREHLAPAGYLPGILVEGDDFRGIDAALLSRLERVGAPKPHKIPFVGMTPGQERSSRGILEAAFRLPDGEILSVFAVHFPAPFLSRELRAQALGFLGGLLAALPADRMAVAAGDFNISSEEDAQYRLLDRHAAGRWLVSHRVGCEDCPGSAYYRPADSWSFLDMILLSKNLAVEGGAPWVVIADSVRVVDDGPHQKAADGTPAPFDAADGSGVSDHFPVVLELEKRR
ncbi:MAG: endonuclease/exonuclease/phosphatase family protein, partial [Elusimicrobiota bacterium]